MKSVLWFPRFRRDDLNNPMLYISVLMNELEEFEGVIELFFSGTESWYFDKGRIVSWLAHINVINRVEWRFLENGFCISF